MPSGVWQQPHGTVLDRLHHLNSMGNLFIWACGTPTHTHTHIKAVALSYFTQRPGLFSPKRTMMKWKRGKTHDLLFILLNTQTNRKRKQKAESRTVASRVPCRCLIQSHLRVIPVTPGTRQDAAAQRCRDHDDYWPSDRCQNNVPVHGAHWKTTDLQTILTTKKSPKQTGLMSVACEAERLSAGGKVCFTQLEFVFAVLDGRRSNLQKTIRTRGEGEYLQQD